MKQEIYRGKIGPGKRDMSSRAPKSPPPRQPQSRPQPGRAAPPPAQAQQPQAGPAPQAPPQQPYAPPPQYPPPQPYGYAPVYVAPPPLYGPPPQYGAPGQPLYGAPVNQSLRNVAFIFNLIATIILAFPTFGIALAWGIPMTVMSYRIIRSPYKHTALGVCSIIFLGGVAGVLILCSGGADRPAYYY